MGLVLFPVARGSLMYSQPEECRRLNFSGGVLLPSQQHMLEPRLDLFEGPLDCPVACFRGNVSQCGHWSLVFDRRSVSNVAVEQHRTGLVSHRACSVPGESD
jgi:hypothetical protein